MIPEVYLAPHEHNLALTKLSEEAAARIAGTVATAVHGNSGGGQVLPLSGKR
jgi:hypothetical protein